MEVIEGPQIDLITPFPTSQMHRIWGWSKAFSNLSIPDDGPRTKEAFEVYMRTYLSQVRSYGIVDRDGLLRLPHPAPLVGIITYEPSNSYNGYLHIATSRSAWGTRMADQALQLAIHHIFTQDPNVVKVSAMVAMDHSPAKALARRVGAKLEGVIRGMAVRDGELMDVGHYGVLYADWQFKPTPVVLKEAQ